MIAAGVCTLDEGRGAYGDEMLVREVYSAMRRVKVVPFEHRSANRRFGGVVLKVENEEG